jgi:flagellar hook-basal body complex protein FliE
MEIEAIRALEVTSNIPLAPSQLPEVSFVEMLGDGVHKVSNDMNVANELVEKFARGEPIAVDEVMVAMEQAQLSLKLAVEVKNKLTAAYQELFRMQV